MCDLMQMMLVRGSLTEILLEVTNEEIRLVASETLSRNRLKGKVDIRGVKPELW